MKKLTLFFFALIAVCLGFQACDNTKTYAEMLEEEKEAIRDFIKKENIQVISQSEFYAQDSVTNLDRNEFVQLVSGVYMQIVDKGSENPADTMKNNDLILVRFMEQDLITGDTTSASNYYIPGLVDEFRYTETSSSIAGIFRQGNMLMYGTSVPAGWLVPLAYVRDRAHVRVIVPAKMGHQVALERVYPYFYDIYKYQIY